MIYKFSFDCETRLKGNFISVNLKFLECEIARLTIGKHNLNVTLSPQRCEFDLVLFQPDKKEVFKTLEHHHTHLKLLV